MREILFRGKSLFGEHDWLYGAYISFEHNFEQKTSILDWSKDSKSNLDLVVIPETVGQYTGLTDKNGVKIYEGDILFFDDHFFEVKYQLARFKALLLERVDDTQILGAGLWSESYIVDNIYL